MNIPAVIDLHSQYQTLADTPNLEVWSKVLDKLVNAAGFSKMLVAMLSKPKMTLDKAFITTTYTDAWRDKYNEHNFITCDPTIEHAYSTMIPQLWTPDIYKTQEQKNLYEESQMFGLTSGITLSMRGNHGERGMFCVNTDAKMSAADLMQSLGYLSIIRDLAAESLLAKLNHKALKTNIRLTASEVKVLEWIIAGKSSNDMAQILSCSYGVVNFHVRNLMNKLNVSSRSVAAIKAIELGLINP